MKVSGFSFVRNAVLYDYPVVESILSVLPLCDEFVMAVGNSTDGTLELIQSIPSPKIKIIQSEWDASLGSKVLEAETNKAFHNISPDSDWAFYVQADEVFHENDIPGIKKAMEKWVADKKVEGLLFNHINFYGSYDYIVFSHKWIKKEVRVIRNDREISSYDDATGFRKKGKRLKVKFADATIYHYGWVKNPACMQKKQRSFHSLWHSEEWVKKNVPDTDEFDYSKMNSLIKFSGSHPRVMGRRISEKKWPFHYDPRKIRRPPLRIRLLDFILKTTGYNVGEYKNYRLF